MEVGDCSSGIGMEGIESVGVEVGVVEGESFPFSLFSFGRALFGWGSDSSPSFPLSLSLFLFCQIQRVGISKKNQIKRTLNCSAFSSLSIPSSSDHGLGWVRRWRQALTTI